MSVLKTCFRSHILYMLNKRKIIYKIDYFTQNENAKRGTFKLNQFSLICYLFHEIIGVQCAVKPFFPPICKQIKYVGTDEVNYFHYYYP